MEGRKIRGYDSPPRCRGMPALVSTLFDYRDSTTSATFIHASLELPPATPLPLPPSSLYPQPR